MSEIANSEGASESEKPVSNDGVIFPPFPDPNDDDFDDDIEEEERSHYKTVFKDLNSLKTMKLHCTACDRHLGCAARNESRMRAHPMLRTLVCHTCHIFYNSGEFEKGDDGSELYCRWCGQGGQVYCCSDCPHVFCAKCVKRNFGISKAKEIENVDDWKCFKCNNKCLWDLRALCWAVLRYCDLKNKMAHQAQDPELKEAYKKDCSVDYSECCKNKSKRNQKTETTKRKEIKKESDVKSNTDAKATSNIISKISPTIQVKKFASVNMDDIKQEKKAQKRSISPKNKAVLVKTPINIAPNTKILNSVSMPSLPKRMKLPPLLVNSAIRVINDRNKPITYTRIKPKAPQTVIGNFNGFNPTIYTADNINLSLENLTQGLDMTNMANLSGNSQDDDVVCTPDFPLEPLCEVTEDNDDDVQCITPGPVVPPKLSNPPPLVPRTLNNPPDVTSDNVVQMTDNDVTVNTATGGLKFRVDPQTLSSNKMYRLPDGRIFAINSNPAMPGGYSATIVAVAEATGKTISKGATYAAKLSSVAPSPVVTPKASRNVPRILKRSTPKATISKIKTPDKPSSRRCDLNVPVEWYRYNLVDAVDTLEYALSRLNKLKKEATTVFLRTRTVDEMRTIHRSLERLLNTSSSRFTEIRENLNKGLKQYLTRKSGGNSEDDDDVEILPDMEVNDDPIFIDENSVESINGSENQEVDLTSVGSEYNDSEENNKSDNFSKSITDPLNDNDPIEHNDALAVISHKNNCVDVPVNAINIKSSANNKGLSSGIVKETEKDLREENETKNNVQDNATMDISENEPEKDIQEQSSTVTDVPVTKTENDIVNKKDNIDIDEETDSNADTIKTDNIDKEDTLPTSNNLECTEKSAERNGLQNEDEDEKNSNKVAEEKDDGINNNDLNDKADTQDSDDRLHDTEMSEEMIETLLKDDIGDEQGSTLKTEDSSEILEET
ncbi:transcriptional regulator ATRX [Spodoptera litura]|uniref:Transcriptional regulator ATRX n=1 Tax=Spodoptera litura TaxID=69820 RepID=A0A9J7EIK9_SPOLT|nr:transcriptional regulator ATRX [Spodoptera litura]